MNCQSCGRLLYANQAKCPCGWKAPERRAEPSAARAADPKDSAAETRRKFAKKLKEIDAYVAMYLAQHRGASQKEACFAYMREHKLSHIVEKILPPNIRDEYREAAIEREAIQLESA